MGFMGHGRKNVEVPPEQKWSSLNLNDFKSSSCFTPLAYCYLYYSLFKSCAVYGVDTFIAVELLAYNHWSSEVKPAEKIQDIAKWIFSICIILSSINLAFEHIRARKVMKRGSVAECYLDSLAVRLESVRTGNGQGWKRFLVFAELTKSKKGAEYVALFTYFSFQAWVRIIICSGPRQVINALTIYTVYTADFGPDLDTTSAGNAIISFIHKLQVLAQSNYHQVLVLSAMIFTFIVWLFSFLSLLLAVLFFVFFLWHWIPKSDGGLSGYCDRKITKRLMKIVTVKVNKALVEEERQRVMAGAKAARAAGEKIPLERQATLPMLMGNKDGDALPAMPSLSRSDTLATLPVYSSRPGTPGGFEMNSLDQKRPLTARSNTNASSVTSYSTGAPLLGAASDMAYGRPSSPASSVPSLDMNNYPGRVGTPGSGQSPGSRPPLERMQTNGSYGQNSAYGAGYAASPLSYSNDAIPSRPMPSRSPTNDNYGRAMPMGQGSGGGGVGGYLNQPYQNSGPNNYDGYGMARAGRSSPAPSAQSRGGSAGGGGPGVRTPTGDSYGRGNQAGYDSQGQYGMGGPDYDGYGSVRTGQPSPGPSVHSRGGSGGAASQPFRSATNPMPQRGPQPYPPQRNMTAPLQQSRMATAEDYYNRPSTSQSQRSQTRQNPYAYGPNLEGQGGSR